MPEKQRTVLCGSTACADTHRMDEAAGAQHSVLVTVRKILTNNLVIKSRSIIIEHCILHMIIHDQLTHGALFT